MSQNSKKISSIKKSGVRKTTSRSKAKLSSQHPDITSLILQDHKPIKELILTLKNPEISFAKKQPAFLEFEKVLTSHAKAEEESLYSEIKQVDLLCVLGIEGDIEHEIAVRLMEEINDSYSDQDTWMAKVKVLADVVDHHLIEEERETLKKARKEFSMDKRIEMGEMYLRLIKKYETEFENPRIFNHKEEIRSEFI